MPRDGREVAVRRVGGLVRLAVTVALIAALGGTTLAAARIMRVTPLARDGWILVSFELADGFTDEVRAAIQSGLPTGFVFDLSLRRPVAIWVDRTIATATVSASVRFDNLTRRYQVSRMLDGRVEDTRVTEDEQTMERWLTSFERLPIFSTASLEANSEYYVRVHAETRPRDHWFFWPWNGAAASAMARFTFIP